MSTKPSYDLVCIGNYTKDTIISLAGIKYVDGGATNYAAHAAVRLGLRVAVVTHLAKEDKRVVDKFIEAGIDCYATYTPASTCMKLEYPTTDPDNRTLSVAATADPILASELKGIRAKSAAIGTSFRGEVGLDVIRSLYEKHVFLGADMQGFVRVLQGQSLVYEAWEEMEEALPYLNVLKSDAVEAAHLTGETNLRNAAHEFAKMGAKEVILTYKDGLLIHSAGEFKQVSFYARALNGRSGRGDTCLGAYMAMRKSLDPFQAAIWAAAVTSLKMEKLGPFDRTREEVAALVREKYPVNPTNRIGSLEDKQKK